MSKEHEYQIANAGRVKAAGVSMEYVTDIADVFSGDPSPETAAWVTKQFSSLRHDPPTVIRDRFFSKDRAAVKALTRGSPAFLRPILKTDQGAGQFLPFNINGHPNKPFYIDYEEGYIIPEAYFQSQLVSHVQAAEIEGVLIKLRELFKNGEYAEARLTYERLQIVCDSLGITLQRDARVGRDGLFFIHPAHAKEPISLSTATREQVGEVVNRYAEVFTDLTRTAREWFARQHGLSVDVRRVNLPPYFQVDIQIDADGTLAVDQMQLPDVGLFLCALDSHGNEALQRVQESVIPLRDGVVGTIRSLVRKAISDPNPRVRLITREEVIKGEQDVLERLEIAVLSSELAKYGIRAHSISPREALELEPGDFGFLLNVDPNDAAYQQLLLKRLKDDRVNIFPDPFLKLAIHEITDYKRLPLSSKDLKNLRAIVGTVETHPDKLYQQLLALDNFLQARGLTTDVFHIYISSQSTPVACLRHDIRSFHLALNEINECDSVEIRAVPIFPRNAILFDREGKAIYSVFRFMVLQNNL